LSDGQASVPSRKGGRLTGSEGLKHGLCSKKRDIDAVHAVMAENIHGLDEEIACLQQLMHGLVERDANETQLAEVYMRASRRLDDLLAAAGKLRAAQEDPRVEGFLKQLDEFTQNTKFPSFSQELRQVAHGLTPREAGSGSIMGEVIATSRLLLRNAHRRAMAEIVVCEYMRIVDLYGRGCISLVRLLKPGADGQYERMMAYFNRQLDRAIRQLTDEWGLDRNDEPAISSQVGPLPAAGSS